MTKIITIIPARMKSGRFPGKPMAKIHGIPMIGHCWYRANMCKKHDGLYVATPDEEVYDYIKSIGGKPVMTSHKHKMCNDRVLEALLKVEKETKQRYDIVLCLQGDQPMVYPQQIEGVLQPLIDDKNLQCTTMMDKITRIEDHDNPNKIKIVVDLNNYVLYMSREPIPSRKKCNDLGIIPMYRHVALTAFQRDFFEKMNSIEMTPLETVESIDDIRYLEHGYKVKAVFTDLLTDTVDTPEDLKYVEKLMKNDNLIKLYKDKKLII
jgi:3-deoxy-manno-octulosonate cytidylyltransferase (CMP-KDO synthetase)